LDWKEAEGKTFLLAPLNVELCTLNVGCCMVRSSRLLFIHA
jgi:hypothetical protein